MWVRKHWEADCFSWKAIVSHTYWFNLRKDVFICWTCISRGFQVHIFHHINNSNLNEDWSARLCSSEQLKHLDSFHPMPNINNPFLALDQFCLFTLSKGLNSLSGSGSPMHIVPVNHWTAHPPASVHYQTEEKVEACRQSMKGHFYKWEMDESINLPYSCSAAGLSN